MRGDTPITTTTTIMTWTQLLLEYCTAFSTHDSMRISIYFINILDLNNMADFDPHSTKLNFNIINSEIQQAIKGSKHDDYFQQLFVASIDLLTALKQGFVDAKVKAEINIVNLLSKKLLFDPSFYLTSVIIVVKDLHHTVFKNFPTDCQIIDDFTNCIQKPFKALISNKTDNSINISAIHIFASHLFSIYFKYNKINALINLYKVLSNTILNDQFNKNTTIDTTPMLPTQALFNYFIGLSLLIQSNYIKAYIFFQDALAKKHSMSLRTKIYFYLLPLRYLIENKLPRDAFFDKNNDLAILKPIFVSMKQLSLAKYNKEISEFKPLFLHFKVYAVYLKLIPKIQLQIVKSTYEVYKSVTDSQKPHIVSISVFATGLQLSPLHTECILCQLVANKKINGYLSHSQQAIVLSKANPFPNAIT